MTRLMLTASLAHLVLGCSAGFAPDEVRPGTYRLEVRERNDTCDVPGRIGTAEVAVIVEPDRLEVGIPSSLRTGWIDSYDTLGRSRASA